MQEEAIPTTPDVLPILRFNEKKRITPPIFQMAGDHLRALATQTATLLNEKMQLFLKQLKEQLLETYENYFVWLHAYLIMYNWTEEDLDPLLEWVRSKAPGCSVTDFCSTWKNGLTLVALLEGIVPNNCVCSQYHILNPKHGKQNVELAFSMAKKYLGVSPTLSAIDVTSGNASNEGKLIRYITMLKLVIARRQNLKIAPTPMPPNQDPLFHDQSCLVRGMGLIAGRRHKPTRFNLYVRHRDQMDILIEINGPHGDYCSHRITNRSPRNQSISSAKLQPNGQTDFISTPYMNIDLEYEILGRSVSVVYWPVSAGVHELNVFWQGRHADESPYLVTVDDCHESPSKRSKLTPHKRKGRLSVSNAKVGQVVNRRVIRQVVFRNGNQIELHDETPLPYDPKAWCGDTCLACQLATDSPHCILTQSDFQLDISLASSVPSENSMTSSMFNHSTVVPLDIFAYQAADQLENVIQEKSTIQIGPIRECYSCEAPRVRPTGQCGAEQEANGHDYKKLFVEMEHLRECKSCEMLCASSASVDTKLEPSGSNQSLKDLHISNQNQEKNVEKSDVDDLELAREPEVLLCGCLTRSERVFCEACDCGVSLHSSDISRYLLGENLTGVYEMYAEASSSFSGSSEENAPRANDNETSSLASNDEFEEGNVEDRGCLTPQTPHSLVKMRVQEWEETISKRCSSV